MIRKTRKMIRQLVHNRSAVRRDLALVLSHASSLRLLLSPYRAEPTVRSELDPHSYNSWGDVVNALSQVLIPAVRDSASPGTLTLQPPRSAGPVSDTGSRWFYINGIATPPPVAMLNGAELARVFRRPITLIHTPTWGALRDVVYSFTARSLRKDGRLSRPAFYVVQQALENNQRVVLVCHSQGTIVASYIVRKLLRSPTTRHLVKNLELYCIGGLADSLEVDSALTREAGHPVPYVEHFANGRDYFAQTGILSHLDSTAGTVFCIPARTGHLFNEHYLAGIMRGDYCNRRSRLYHYARGREPQPRHYMPVHQDDVA